MKRKYVALLKANIDSYFRKSCQIAEFTGSISSMKQTKNCCNLCFSAQYYQIRRNHQQRRHHHSGRSRTPPGGGGVVPAVVKVVNVISDIGHGANIVAKKVGKASQPIIKEGAAQWRKTVDQHIMPSLNQARHLH